MLLLFETPYGKKGFIKQRSFPFAEGASIYWTILLVLKKTSIDNKGRNLS
jgi:hypothetical protein